MADRSRAFWRPGAAAPGLHEVDRGNSAEDEGAGVLALQREQHALSSGRLTIFEARAKLALFEHREQFLNAVEHSATVVVVAEPGSGKSTQLVQYLHEAGWTADGRRVVATQPRRVAVLAACERVSEELGARELVGYSVPFSENCGDAARIVFATDAVLVGEALADPLLSCYAVVVVDGVDERAAQTDVLIGLLQRIQARRRELRIVLACASADARLEALFRRLRPEPAGASAAQLLGLACEPVPPRDVCTLVVPSRAFPVDEQCLAQPCASYAAAAVDAALAVAGHTLVFVPREADVAELARLLGEADAAAEVLPLHAHLAPAQQAAVFAEPAAGRRRIVLATQIAELLLLPYVSVVIDAGFASERQHDPTTGLERVACVAVSRAAARRRAACAGRAGGGLCLRLYTAEACAALAEHATPELARSDLTGVVLRLRAFGIRDLGAFPFVDAPPSALLVRALELLFALGALDREGALTARGRLMAALPVAPELARALLAACESGCGEELATIAACLSVRELLVVPRAKHGEGEAARRHFGAIEGDAVTALNVYNACAAARFGRAWCAANFVSHAAVQRARGVRAQLVATMRRLGLALSSLVDSQDRLDCEPVLRALVAGFFARAAARQADGSYRTLRDAQAVRLAPQSTLHRRAHPAEWIVFCDSTADADDVAMVRDATAIEPLWLTQLAPDFVAYTSPGAAARREAERADERDGGQAGDDGAPAAKRARVSQR